VDCAEDRDANEMGYGYSIAMTILGINRMYSKWRAKNLATARTRLQMKLQGSGFEYYANSEEVGDVHFVLSANSHSRVSPRDFLYHVSKQEIHCCSSHLYPKEVFLSSSSKAKNYEYMVMQELA
jgi:hypothetical protein